MTDKSLIRRVISFKATCRSFPTKSDTVFPAHTRPTGILLLVRLLVIRPSLLRMREEDRRQGLRTATSRNCATLAATHYTKSIGGNPAWILIDHRAPTDLLCKLVMNAKYFKANALFYLLTRFLLSSTLLICGRIYFECSSLTDKLFDGEVNNSILSLEDYGEFESRMITSKQEVCLVSLLGVYPFDDIY